MPSAMDAGGFMISVSRKGECGQQDKLGGQAD